MEERHLQRDWECLLSLLPPGWLEAAKDLGAFCWGRNVRTAEGLVRLVLAYSVGGLSLRGTVAWAEQAGIVASLSDVALLKRLCKAGDWLAWMVREKLAEAQVLPAWSLASWRLRIVDATVVSKPGSRGTDWRVHLGFDLSTWRLDTAQITDASGGETLRRFAAGPGDIVLGDRAYATRGGIHHVVAQGADVLVRMTWQNLPLMDRDGRRIEPLALLRRLEAGHVGDWEVWTVPDEKGEVPAIAGRMVALPKPPAEAEKGRRRLRREAKRKGKEPARESLEAAGYVFVFTTLARESFPAERVLDLYRLRWQVEMAIKRMKSILLLDAMAAKSAALCRTFLLGKLLAVLLVEDVANACGAFPPCGAQSSASVVPVAGVAGGV